MELVRGRDCYAATEGKDWRGVVDVTVQVCRALAYMHAQRVIHFDLKPDNLCVDRAGTAKVLDFGLALAASSAAGQIRGTPAYMAPEMVLDAASVDHRYDLYSLGVILYEMLTRSPPFAGPTAAELLRQHVHAPITWRPEHVEAVPLWLRQACERLCAKEPARRYQNADEVIAEMGARGRSAWNPRRFAANICPHVGGCAALDLGASTRQLAEWIEELLVNPNVVPRRISRVVMENVRARLLRFAYTLLSHLFPIVHRWLTLHDEIDFDLTYGTETRLLAPNNYGPVQVSTFRSVMNATASDHDGRVFVDIGAGRGRACLLAADYPFRRIVGVEMMDGHLAIAEKNIKKARGKIPNVPRIELECTNALLWVRDRWPVNDDVFLFMYRPFTDDRLYGQFFQHLGQQLKDSRARLTLGFVNPPGNLELLLKPLGLHKIAEGGMQSSYLRRIIFGWQCYRRDEQGTEVASA